MQHVIDGLLASALILPVAIGFAVVYRATHVLHFAHGAIVALGGYTLYGLFVAMGVPLWLALVFVCAVAGFTGVMIETGVYAPIRRRGGRGLITFIASLGLYVIIVHFIAVVAGEGTYTARFWGVHEGWSVGLGNARIAPSRLLIGAAGVGAACLGGAALVCTRLGRLTYAVACDGELALIAGVPVASVRAWAAGVGSVLAGFSGALLAFDVGVEPGMGLSPLLSGVVAALIGGRRVWGVACGALLLGMSMHVSALWVAAKWQDATVFLILLALLAVNSVRGAREQAKD